MASRMAACGMPNMASIVPTSRMSCVMASFSSLKACDGDRGGAAIRLVVSILDSDSQSVMAERMIPLIENDVLC